MAIEHVTLLALSLIAGSNELVVNSASDGPVDLTDQVVTLRDAIAAANDDVAVSPGGVVGNGFDSIVFDDALIGATITLTEGRLRVNESLSIFGPGAGLLTVSAGGNSRHFLLGGPGVNEYEFFDLTLADGRSSDDFQNDPLRSGGGSIGMNDGTDSVLLDGVTLRNNSTPNRSGGAILVAFGSLTIRNSSVIDTTEGQRIVQVQDGTANVASSTFSGNDGTEGVIWARNSELILNGVTIADNALPAVFFSAEGEDESATVIYRNSVFANADPVEFEAGLVTGVVTLTSMGYNIINDGSGSPNPDPTDLIATDPRLTPRTEVAGQFVLRPAINSPAIDAADSASAAVLDQLGSPRIDGDGSGTVEPDIGAVEFQDRVFKDDFRF